MEYTIDATNKSLGRLSTEIASMLMGKRTPNVDKAKAGTDTVVVLHTSKMKLSDKKQDTTYYKNFSGYPGGLKHTSMRRMIEKKGFSFILRSAVHGMLPANRLRKVRLARLLISE